jgi:hypothetical protein
VFADASGEDRGGLESLLRAAGKCPEPSRGLRERILAEAVPARAAVVRRKRRALAGVAAVLAIGLVPFVRPLPIVRTERPAVAQAIGGATDRFGREATAVGGGPAHETGRTPHEAGAADWKLVEATASVQRSRIDRLRSALGA